MKILITGANGQLGRCLKAVLSATEFQCLFLSRNELDICDQGAVKRFIEDYQPQVILNTAAFTVVDLAEQNPQLALQTNSEAISNLISVANKVGAVIFHFSTDYVFSGEGDGLVREEDIPAPLNEYGLSKWGGEKFLQSHAKKYLIVRSSWLFSGYGNNFVTKIIERAKKQSELSVVCDEVGAPTYAMDLAEVVNQLLTQYKQQGDLEWGIYHYCGSPAVSRYEFATEIVAAAANVGIFSKDKVWLRAVTSAELNTSLTKRPLKVVLDCDKIKRVFGVEQRNWRDGLITCMRALSEGNGI